MRLWRKRPRTPRIGKADLQRFAELCFSGDPEGQLKLIVLHVLMHSTNDREKIAGHARRWDLNADKTEQLIRGEVADLPWYAIEGTLSDCGAAAVDLQLAQDLYHRCARLRSSSAPASQTPAHQMLPDPASPGVRAAADGLEESPPGDDVVEETGPELLVTAEPDPSTARTADELLALMRAFRVWTGKPSFRSMASAIGERYSYSTLAALLTRGKLPKREQVTSFIEACLKATGRDPDPQAIAAWERAWQRIALTEPPPPETT